MKIHETLLSHAETPLRQPDVPLVPPETLLSPAEKALENPVNQLGPPKMPLKPPDTRVGLVLQNFSRI